MTARKKYIVHCLIASEPDRLHIYEFPQKKNAKDFISMMTESGGEFAYNIAPEGAPVKDGAALKMIVVNNEGTFDEERAVSVYDPRDLH